MTTLTEQFSLDEIGRQARQVKPGRAALTVVAAVLFGIGWIVARVFAVVWLAVMWCGVAVREGWRASHGPSRSQKVAALTAQVSEMETELRRLR